MSFIKNYFFIFIISYLVLFFTKILFAFYFHGINFSYIYAVIWGYKFDFATSGIIALLATFLDFHKKSLITFACVLILVVFCIQIGDIMYFYDSQRHISYEIKDALNDAYGLIFVAITTHKILLLSSIAIFVILGIFSYKFLSFTCSKVNINKSYVFKKLFLIALSVFFIRGMFTHIPLNPWQANQIGNQSKAMVALNGTYNLIYSNLRNKSNIQQNPKYQSIDEIKSVKSLYSKSTLVDKPLNSPNIVMFFLESFSATFLKTYGDSVNAAPYLDEYIKNSFHPKGMISNGHRTTEGMFATLTSFQNPLGQSVAKTKLQSYNYVSLIGLLKKYKNYSSAFFQGTNKETSGTGSLAQSLGFEFSYGKADVKKRIYEENFWGVHDKDLYNFAYEKLSSMNKPFIIGINGATTHDLTLPKGIKVKKYVENEEQNMRYNTFSFADESMHEFVQSIKKTYPNTIFIFLADHCGSGINDSNFLNYFIPFAIHGIGSKYINEYVSQRDIAPTIVDLIIGDYTKIAPSFSGKSLLRDSEFFGDYYHNGVLGIVKDDIAYEYNNDKITCYDVSSFKDKQIKCPPHANEISNQVKSFTNISQDLLFDGKTYDFYKYR